MSSNQQIPIDLWTKNDDLTTLNVLANMLNMMRQPIDVVEDLCQTMLQGNLIEQTQIDIEIIATEMTYLRSIMDAALEYKNKVARHQEIGER